MTDVINRESPVESENAGSLAIRLVDRLDRRLVNVLTGLGFAVPVLGYLWIVVHDSLNVLINDQLADVTVAKAGSTTAIPWEALWAQHNEHRMFFPNLIVVALVHTTHLDVRVEEYLSFVLLVAATALLIWAHKRRSPATPWLYYCPVALLTFSLVQYENMLWGFQVAWYLVLLSLALVVNLLDRYRLGWLPLVGAIAAAAVGSYSSFQGLFIWPVGLVLLYHRRRRLPSFVVWMAAGVATVWFYFRNLDTSSGLPYPHYASQHLWSSAKFYLFAVGDVAGVPVRVGGGDADVVVFGLLIVVLAIAALVAYGVRRNDQGGAPVGVALICFGLLFAGSITQGRAVFGYWGASASRYTTYDLMILVGIYLTTLGQPSLLRANQASGQADGRLTELLDDDRARDRWQPAKRAAFRAFRWAVAGVIVIQILVGVGNGLTGVRNDHAHQMAVARVLTDLDHSADIQVSTIDPWKSAEYDRQQASEARRLRLSLYSGITGRTEGAR